jgi:PAS domain S-box-containing protein
MTDAQTIESASSVEARYRAIVETSPECVKLVAPDGTLLQMNAAGLALVGARTQSEAIGTNVYDFIAPEHREAFRAFNERVCAGERGVLEFDIVGLRGERRSMESHAAPLRMADGRCVQLALTRDMTQRKRAEQALRASEERYRRLIGLLPAAVYTCGANGVITFYNEQAAALWGRAPRTGDTDERFCGSYRLWRPDGTPLPHARTPMAVAIAEGREFRNEDVVIERPDGSRISVLVNIDPLRDEHGRVTGAINVFHDTTALKQAEAALREADRHKDEFLATLSHELRNPLAPLRNALNLLRLSGAADGAHAATHQMMERQVNQLVRMVDDLLEISRVSLGTFELRKERIALDTVVRNALETSNPLMREAGHELVVSLPAEPLWLEGDPVRLSQILANLLNNAARYSDPGGRIAVRAEHAGGEARIAVQDNGHGIAPEDLPRLFAMFMRSERSRQSSQGGLGIGLALTRRLAEMHGGAVEARSDGVDRGSEFTVRLPLAAPPPGQEAGERRPAPVRGAGLRRRILVVDDNRDAGDSLGMILRHLGADVRVARDGDEALEAFAAYAPAVVLLDIGMPGMDGYEVARRMRALNPGRPSALVALTGWGQEEDRRRAREAGFDHHLVKPAELHDIQALLASLEDPGQDSARH